MDLGVGAYDGSTTIPLPGISLGVQTIGAIVRSPVKQRSVVLDGAARNARGKVYREPTLSDVLRSSNISNPSIPKKEKGRKWDSPICL